MIFTPCPVRRMNIEVYQNHRKKTYSTKFHIPATCYSTLMAAAYGRSAKEAGLGGQAIRARQLEKIAKK